ncbi:ATP-binding cassette domain-containing protein [Cohnella sp. CFH 77786]|uniref:ATP-binding cassette domain-containing protein n=1 Tax=Cohnella sp. CFH 77786 TaxID=2662265 RepID=UPI001C60DD37|nr:ABC transporter ATP-binding protein [Cohnella sp. CFH 77786]MBW5445537.1 ATP-binding cassette domain-containing protein [Cohnella sp. CFH 77786]
MDRQEQPAIRLDGVKAGREGFRLGPLHAEIPRGWVTAVVGANGSGKSTLFRTLLGLEPVTDGRLEVLGTPVVPHGDESYKARIGFVAESPNAHENPMTVAEKAEFASYWYPGWDWQRYRRLAARFGVDEGAKLKKLSKGTRRKAELAIAMAHDPDLLILDEPSSGLDPFIWKIWMEELQSYLENGDKTLLLATHVTEEVKRLADNVLFLHQGRCLGLYEKDLLFDAWRSLLVRETSPGADAGKLRGVPGFCQMESAGPGLYRIEVEFAAGGGLEAYLQACGFQVLESRRLELEDILGCLIQKEEANVEPA